MRKVKIKYFVQAFKAWSHFRPKNQFSILQYFRPNYRNRCPISDHTKNAYKRASENTAVVTKPVFCIFLFWILRSGDPRKIFWRKVRKIMVHSPQIRCKNQTRSKLVKQTRLNGPDNHTLKGGTHPIHIVTWGGVGAWGEGTSTGTFPAPPSSGLHIQLANLHVNISERSRLFFVRLVSSPWRKT